MEVREERHRNKKIGGGRLKEREERIGLEDWIARNRIRICGLTTREETGAEGHKEEDQSAVAIPLSVMLIRSDADSIGHQFDRKRVVFLTRWPSW